MMKKLLKCFFYVIPYLVVLVIVVVLKPNFAMSRGGKTTITSSTLTEAINISELSSAQFTYNGIAEVYEEGKEKVKCYIKYNAFVNAGIDMSAVTFDIDRETKVVRPQLPSITITSNSIDDKVLSFIPEDTDIGLGQALEVCKKDALEEAQKSPQFIEIAKENIHAIIEALLLPILTPEGYTISWT